MVGIFGAKAKASSPPPAVGALNIQQSSYGTPIPLVYGANRVTGNLIWYDDFYSVQVSTGGGGGGKGGGGGGGGKGGGGSYEYNYYTSFALGICEGPISGTGFIWESKAQTEVNALGGTVFTGTTGQQPWGYLTSKHPDKALGYNNLAYIGFGNFFLGSSAETPNLSIEVFGLKAVGDLPSGHVDAYAEDVVSDFLARSAWPISYLGDLSVFGTYCKAMGFFISPVIDQQRPATDWLGEWVSSLNSEFVWVSEHLKIIPYGDAPVNGNGASYVPNLTPEYDLTDDDFIVSSGEDPITCSRMNLADAYNQMPVEYKNRNNQYNIETYTTEDAAHIDMFGIRTASTIQAHHFTDPAMAQQAASIALWRQLYVRTTYHFKLGWKHILLDPMDLVTLTDATLGLNRTLVRITDIEEDEDGQLSFTAEEMPGDIALPAIYPSQAPNRYLPDYSSDPGMVNAPVLFEAPIALVQASDVEVWVGLSSSNANWGGCNIYVSTDGETYTYLDQIKARARQGVLTAILATSAVSLDELNTLSVDMTESMGIINGSATNADATALNTICYVDGEIIAFGNSSMVAQYKYNLTYLVRGAYDSPISSHAIGKPFLRLDQSVFKYPVDQSRIGQTIYFKFQSFNIYGGGLQTLDSLGAYTYTITGSALLEPLPNPTNFNISYSDNIAQLNWSPIIDIRSPIYYEIRQGASFENAQIIGRTTQVNFPVYGNGTYWVSALYFTPLGAAAYSAVPPSLVVSNASLRQNLIQLWDENATGWTGTFTGGLSLVAGQPELTGSGDILTTADILTTPDVLFLGGVASSGTYTIPVGHEIASAYIANGKVIISWDVRGLSLNDDVLSQPDVLSMDDFLGQEFQPFVYAVPQIRLSQNNGATWGAWINWVPGVYQFNKIDALLNVYSSNPQVTAIVYGFTIEVDVPLRVDTGSSTSSAGGDVTVTYATPFNVAPLPQITINNASQGDDVILISFNASGFTYKIINGGARVSRVINWQSQSY